MKNKVCNKAIYGLAVLFLISLSSCDSDDDLPVLPTLVVNSFCYGLDAANSFESTAAFNSDVIEIRSGVFSTAAFITDSNLTVDSNGEFQGVGVLLEVVLYGNRNTVFQAGTYRIDSNQEVGNAIVGYDIDYDSTNTTNRGISLASGYVSVTPYQTGYAIEIDGEDTNGDRFHGIYLGNITPL